MKKKIFINLSKELPGVRENILLKEHTTYKIGGPARYFFIAKTKEDLISALCAAKKFKLPVFILGGGSNLLVSDKGFFGLVIKIDIRGIEFEDSKAFVGAGENLTELAHLCAKQGLSGLEWAAGIPGTFGGAVYGHAQAFGEKTSDIVKKVQAVDVKSLKIKNLSQEECQFSLKNSIFKEKKNLVIVSASLQFNKKTPAEIKNKIAENLNYRKIRHPINFPSAGSTFVNPELKKMRKELIKKYPELINYLKKGVVPAGYLIAQSQLAGRKQGGAQISEKHTNFIINLGGAKAKDVLKLINLAKNKVKKKFNISLKTEVQFVGF